MYSTVMTNVDAKALALSSLERGEGLSITPVIHPKDGVPDPRSRTFWSAVANVNYIMRTQGTDLFGPTPDLAEKLAGGNDLVDHGRRGPIGCNGDAVRGMELWNAADHATRNDRPSVPVAHHLIGWLPAGTTHAHWRELTLEFLDREIAGGGMVADWAIHALADPRNGWIKKPHLHAIVTHRFWKAGRRTGEPNGAWLGSVKQRQKVVDAWERLTAR